MADDKKSKPRLFQAGLFSPSPSSLPALNLSGDRTASTGPIPLIVPQIVSSSSPDPFQQQTHKDSGQPFSTTDLPPSESQGLSQVDLSDETPTEDPRGEQAERHEPDGVFSTPDSEKLPAVTVAMSAELEIDGETRSGLRSGTEQADLRLVNPGTPQPSRLVNPGTPASGGGAGHNPYRAQSWQRPTHQPTYTLPTSPQQFVPVPGTIHTQSTEPIAVAPLSVSQPEIHQATQQPMYGQQQPMIGQTTVQAYWFFVDRRGYWTPFSKQDSSKVEIAYQSGRSQDESCFITTDGERYDICLGTRTRQAVYWEEPVSEVRRCTWFFKGETDRYFAPYQENMAERLEVWDHSHTVLYSSCVSVRVYRVSISRLCSIMCGTDVLNWGMRGLLSCTIRML